MLNFDLHMIPSAQSPFESFWWWTRTRGTNVRRYLLISKTTQDIDSRGSVHNQSWTDGRNIQEQRILFEDCPCLWAQFVIKPRLIRPLCLSWNTFLRLVNERFKIEDGNQARRLQSIDRLSFLRLKRTMLWRDQNDLTGDYFVSSSCSSFRSDHIFVMANYTRRLLNWICLHSKFCCISRFIWKLKQCPSSHYLFVLFWIAAYEPFELVTGGGWRSESIYNGCRLNIIITHVPYNHGQKKKNK